LLDRSLLAAKQFLDRESHVACDLAEQCRRYVTARVERNRRSSAICVSVLPVRASLTRLHESEPLKEPATSRGLRTGRTHAYATWII
jgi:hypothetical protein